jgi:Fur family ferric uptake transcriptional regulator
MQTHDCKKELHTVALKVTPVRLKVLDVLEHADVPLDAATIKGRVNADKVTVFRILNSLTEKGLLKPIQFNDGKLRYEYAGKPKHHHFICENCGKIIDVEGCTIGILEKDIEKEKGVLVKRHSLEFFGLCADCQN